MVGCVIVHDEEIIAEGFTSPYGGPHAEVNAINSVKDKSLLRDATLYVTLEPCSHYGKTPPCADLIASHQIPNVYIGIQDPNDKVAGMGIKKLEDAGCKVTVGILEAECREHHKRFLTYQEKKRPYIILKWAETQDGFMAPDKTQRNSNPEPYWITNAYSRQLVHQWRSEEQAILVGTNTVLEDNPELNTRDWAGKNPIRVIIDKDLRIGTDFHVLDKFIKTMVLTQEKDTSKYIDGIDYETMDYSRPIASQICNSLHKHSITSIIVEGGAKTLQSFLDEGLWDEARVFVGPPRFASGIPAPKFKGTLKSTQNILSDLLSIYTHD